MKRCLIASALLATAVTASAGLTYKVQSSTTGAQPINLAGTVNVDGTRMRFDVANGDGMLFQDNSLVLSSAAGRTMSIFDPAPHNYSNLHPEQLPAPSTANVTRPGARGKAHSRKP